MRATPVDPATVILVYALDDVLDFRPTFFEFTVHPVTATIKIVIGDDDVVTPAMLKLDAYRVRKDGTPGTQLYAVDYLLRSEFDPPPEQFHALILQAKTTVESWLE